jgi:prepilin-type N-terminal cleavage/methylation domain-containing protein/prepilin-type processing-associated H-X9-DG protein
MRGRFVRGFTLVELLTVVAVIAVLVALSISGAKTALKTASKIKCANRLRTIYQASESYCIDNNGWSLPARFQNAPGVGNAFWFYILRTYLGPASMFSDICDSQYRCTAIKSTDTNYWAWGYGMNATPGYEGASSSGTMTRYNYMSYSSNGQAYTWASPFMKINITFPSKRLFVCDSTEWQMPYSMASTYPDIKRHGGDGCNVLFYDGHVEYLKADRAALAVTDPSQF